MKFLIFWGGMGIFLLVTIYRKQIVDFTGKMAWAEQKLGAGGTYTLLILLGLVVWMGCMMYALGSFDQLFGFLGKFF